MEQASSARSVFVHGIEPTLDTEATRRQWIEALAAGAHFGPLRQSTVADSHHRSHTAQTRALHAYLRWRNTNTRHPDALAAQR